MAGIRIVTGGRTPEGTPVADRERSDFSLSRIPMQNADSTCFSEIGYDEEAKLLAVTFRQSGSTYLYYAVPKEEWDAFRGADSLGGYFNARIIDRYDCCKY